MSRQARHLASVRRRRLEESGHDAAFAAFQARREAERAAAVKVTWRKVSPMTGGGWSALGPEGRLGFVAPKQPSGYPWGLRDGKEKVVQGHALTLASAKAAVEQAFVKTLQRGEGQPFRTVEGSCNVRGVKGEVSELTKGPIDAEPTSSINDDGGKAARKEATMATETTNPTAESLMEGLGTATSPDKAPYSRLQVNGKTLAYCSTRKDGVLLDFAAGIVEDAPARFQKCLTTKGTRATLRVTAKNAKTARALLEWVAKQIAS